MPTIFLSPSTQENNLYVTGNSEEYWMNRLADAMDVRGYNAGEKRSRMEPLEYHRIDRVAAGIMLLYAAGMLVIRIFM